MRYENLDHLSSEEVERLIARYYRGEDIEALMREYKIAVRPNSLYRLFPPRIVDDEFCEYCGGELLQDRVSRAEASLKYRSNYPYCPRCKHYPYSGSCGCQNCRDKERLQLMGRLLEGEIDGEE